MRANAGDLQFTTDYKRGQTDIKQHSAYVGNSTKSLHISVEQSLKKLRTSYIDILYVHWVSDVSNRASML